MAGSTLGLWTVRCNWAGTSCPLHGRVVKARTAREAIGKVVDLQAFGPVHRLNATAITWIALVRPRDGHRHGWGNGDTGHGAIYARRGRSRYRGKDRY
jgi:hypothetical protein